MMNIDLNKAIEWAINHDKQLKPLNATLEHLTDIYPYHNQDGQELFVKVRFDKDGKKWIKPFHFNGSNYRIGEPKTDKKPLYMPKPFDDVVYIVEGEKCVHALINVGLSATTTGGATSVHNCDLTPLKGRKCVIWRDNDGSGIKWQDELITALNSLSIEFKVIDIAGVKLPNGDDLPNKGDCADYIQSYYADGHDDKGVVSLIVALPYTDITPPNSTHQSDDLTMLDMQVAELDQTITELAELDEKRLHLIITKVSKEFGVSKDKLLQWVYEYKQGELVADTSPYPDNITGDELYHELYKLIDDYIVIDEPLKVAFVLWVLFTYLVDISEIAPIAWITAPEKSCGKSTLLGLFERVVYKPYNITDPSQAVLYRVMDKYKPTLLIDEIDTGLKENKSIIGILNAGYSRHACHVPKTNMDKGGTVESFNAFGAKVLCGIGRLIGTTASRAIRFELKRKSNTDKVQRLNMRTLPRTQTDIIRQKAKRWSNDHHQQIKDVEVELLPINDRDFDNWYILLQIAHVLGVYDKARQACLSICQRDKEPSLNERLLSDVRDIWQGDKMTMKMIVLELNSLDDAPWSTCNDKQPMNTNKLGAMLRNFGIKATSVNIQGHRGKGYYKTALAELWERYLKPQEFDYPFD